MDEEIKKLIEEQARLTNDLRDEVKKSGAKSEVVDRMSTRLDQIEEKINQPLTALQEQAKTDKAQIQELREKLEESGASALEAKSRMDELEHALARRGGPASADGPTYRETDEYKSLVEYCRKGLRELPDEHKAVLQQSMEEKATLRTDSATLGGFLVPMEMDTMITKKITEFDRIRSIARVRSISAKTLDMAIRSTIPQALYEGETEAPGTTTNSTYENTMVTPFRQQVKIPVTQDLLMDSAFDMESEIMSDAAESMAFGEGVNFVAGDGHKKPQGFTVQANLVSGARITAVSGILDPEAIILLTGDLKVGYDPVYVLNRRTLALIRTFRGDAASPGDGQGQFLWQPGLNGPAMNTLNGFPYILANSMPDVANGAIAMAFGDFRRGYTITDRTGTSVIRDEFTQADQAVVNFTIRRWNTGQVTLEEPIKLLQIKA